MAQRDKLLSHLVPKGGIRMHLRADRKPWLDLRAGGTLDLLPNPLPGVMVEVLASDVIPPALKATWQSDGEVEFDYDMGGYAFRIHLSKDLANTQLDAEHLGPARISPPAVPAPVAAAPPPAVRPEPGK